MEPDSNALRLLALPDDALKHMLSLAAPRDVAAFACCSRACSTLAQAIEVWRPRLWQSYGLALTVEEPACEAGGLQAMRQYSVLHVLGSSCGEQAPDAVAGFRFRGLFTNGGVDDDPRVDATRDAAAASDTFRVRLALCHSYHIAARFHRTS